MGEASEGSLRRLATALERHDAGLLRASIEAQIDKGADEKLVVTLIGLVESLPVTESAKAAEMRGVRKVAPATRRRVQQKAIEIAPGYYAHPADGRTVKVQRSQSSGFCYAMDMVDGKWKFISGLIKELRSAQRVQEPGKPNDQVALNNLVREVSARRAASA